MSKKTKRVTMTDVADMAGVSKPVVSAILKSNVSKNSRYSEATKKKVLDAAAKLKYRPNRTARNFIQNRHGIIGVLISRMSVISHLTYTGMMRESANFDQVVLYEDLHRPGGPLFLREDMADGIIVFENIPDEMEEEIQRLEIPLVRVNTEKSETGTDISFDDMGAMKPAIEHFASLGKKAPAYFCPKGGKNAFFHKRRITGLKQFSKDAGMTFVPDTYYSDSQKDKTSDPVLSMIEILEKHPEIDSAVVNMDIHALILYEAIRSVGKSIPDEVSVIAMHSGDLTQRLKPTLTALNIEMFEVGVAAVQLMNKILNREKLPESAQIIEYALEKNGS